jgi:hypothetical protein
MEDSFPAGDGGAATLDSDVVALLPVLSAAAIRLAHTAFGCVRIMEKKVLKVSGASWASNLLQVSALVFVNALIGMQSHKALPPLLCRRWRV